MYFYFTFAVTFNNSTNIIQNILYFQIIMKKNTEISERISEVIDYLNITKAGFSKKLGYQRAQTVYDIVNGTSAPSFDFFSRFYNTEYSELFNTNWIMTGNGEMLKQKEIAKKADAVLATDQNIYGKSKMIPLVAGTAIGGFGNSSFLIEQKDIKDYYVIPKFAHKKIDFMIEVEGSSMYPKYNSGDVVACRIINENTFIQWNKTHVVATRDQGIIIKRIKRADENNLLMISDNKDYDPFTVPTTEIDGIALVVGVIRLE